MTALARLKLSLSMRFGNANSPKRGFGLAQRLKGLEDENRRLKKLLAEAMLDVSALKDILGKN
jgi:hypothetical protein